MTERPILFSGPMVRAILEGRKTQTRRVVKPQPKRWALNDAFLEFGDGAPLTLSEIETLCPYGASGDRLWVRETWRARRDQDHLAPRDVPRHAPPWYCATGGGHGDEEPSGCAGGVGKKRPAIFMPRWASRITLEITDVRVQRLEEISEEDARAEGVEPAMVRKAWGPHQEAFQRLWDAINQKRAPWSSNPWVWVITFRRAD